MGGDIFTFLEESFFSTSGVDDSFLGIGSFFSMVLDFFSEISFTGADFFELFSFEIVFFGDVGFSSFLVLQV